MLPENIKIGTSGFSYKDWLGNFYPQFCPQTDFLRFYSSQFKTVEIDATFYQIPSETTVKKWSSSTPASFTFTAKFPRTVTHEGTLEDRLNSANRFIMVMQKLGPKLGPLLLQFPYSFKPESYGMLEELLTGLTPGIRICVELRNKNWLMVERLFNLLESKNIAFCLIDHPWMPKITIATADFHYIRFLGDRKKIYDDFSYIRFDREEELDWWKDIFVDFAVKGKEIFGFFNNHYSGHSPTTAKLMIEILGKSIP